jgi:TRAP-type C4-dicarboxylate transport system permease small subunit
VKTIEAIATALSRFLYVIAGVALAGSMFLTVADVVLRSFKMPIVGTYELVGLLGAVVIGFSMPQTSRLRGHVIMDFVTEKLPSGVQSVLKALTRLLAIVLFAVIGWNLAGLGNGFRRTGEVTLTLHIPLYPVAYAIAFCCLVECLVLFPELYGRRGTTE